MLIGLTTSLIIVFYILAGLVLGLGFALEIGTKLFSIFKAAKLFDSSIRWTTGLALLFASLGLLWGLWSTSLVACVSFFFVSIAVAFLIVAPIYYWVKVAKNPSIKYRHALLVVMLPSFCGGLFAAFMFLVFGLGALLTLLLGLCSLMLQVCG